MNSLVLISGLETRFSLISLHRYVIVIDILVSDCVLTYYSYAYKYLSLSFSLSSNFPG